MGWQPDESGGTGADPDRGPGLPGGAPPARNPRLDLFASVGGRDAIVPSGLLALAADEVSGPERRCRGANGDELTGLLRAWAAVESWAAGAKLAVIAEMIRRDDGPRPGGGRHGDLPDEWSPPLRHDLALALACSVPSAETALGLAWELQARLPGIGALLDAGILTLPKARAVIETFKYLTDTDAASAEALILDQLTGKTYTQVLRLAEQAALTVDPGVAERRREQSQKRDARVTLFRELSGAAGLSGRDLPPDEALAAMASVNARAQQYENAGAFGDTPMDVLRAYAYLDLIKGTPAEVRIACAEAQDEAADAAEALAWANARAARNAAQAEARQGVGAEPEAGPGTDSRGGAGNPPIPGSQPGPGPRPGPVAPGAGLPGRAGDADGDADADAQDGPHDCPYGDGRDDFTASDPSKAVDDRDGNGGNLARRHDNDDDDPDDPGDVDDDNGGPGPGGPGSGGPGSGCSGFGGGSGTGASAAGRALQPRPPDLVIPLVTLLGLSERPGEVQGFGLLDPALARDMAAAAAASPRTEVCVTVTSPEGYAIGHGCARPDRALPSPQTVASPGAAPARLNLTISATALAGLAVSAGPWAFTPRGGTGPPGGTGQPDGYGTWTLVLPDGRRFTVRLDVVPTFACDHRYETHRYRPSARLRHLIQVRDGTCTFPPCNRHAREADFEHAIPYEKGGKTCCCNAGARSRACHRVKQAKGWNVTQLRPGWHQWTTPSGRVYVQEPKRYLA